MKIDRDQWICKRAYALWEEAGRPDGRDQENWSKAVAEFEIMEKTRASVDGAEILKFRGRQKKTPARPNAATQYGSLNRSPGRQPWYDADTQSTRSR